MTAKRFDKELFKQLWIQGKKAWEIANIMGISIYTVHEWRKRLNLPSRREQSRQRREIFKKLYLEGKTYREISNEIKVSIPTLMQWRRKLGLPKRGPQFSIKEKLQQEALKLEIREKMYDLISKTEIINIEEAAKLLNTNKYMISEAIRGDRRFAKLVLHFKRSPAGIPATKIFGKYTGKTFVYLRGTLQPVRNLIIRVVKETLGRPLKRGEVLALRYRLKESIHLPKEVIDDIIWSLTYGFY